MPVAAVLGAALSGCGEGPAGAGQASGSPTAAEGTASPAATEWMDRFCGVVHEFHQTSVVVETAEGELADPEALRQELRSRLDAAIDGIPVVVEKLESLGAAPVAGGDEAAAGLAGRFRELETLFTTARDRLVALPAEATEPEIGRAVAEAMPELGRLLSNPYQGAEVTQAMRDAGAEPLSPCRSYPPLR